MGGIAPIYEDEWPLIPVPDTEILWRYLDFRKFEHLLKNRALYMARPDSFKDPFEGRLSTGNASQISSSEKAFRALYKIAPTDDANCIEIMRDVVFISCWHRNRRESWRMWHAYTSSPESVVVVTSAMLFAVFFQIAS